MSNVEVYWHEHVVSRQQREEKNNNKGCVVWFTGLSACGKSTVANLVDYKLFQRGASSFVLDGDNVRHGLNAAPKMLMEKHSEEFAKRFGLGFSAIDREENIRRIGAVASLFASAGIVAITAFISPYRRDRDNVRASLPEGLGSSALQADSLPTELSVQFSSVAQSCPTLCDPMDCSMPGFPVHHQLLELARTHVH